MNYPVSRFVYHINQNVNCLYTNTLHLQSCTPWKYKHISFDTDTHRTELKKIEHYKTKHYNTDQYKAEQYKKYLNTNQYWNPILHTRNLVWRPKPSAATRRRPALAYLLLKVLVLFQIGWKSKSSSIQWRWPSFIGLIPKPESGNYCSLVSI